MRSGFVILKGYKSKPRDPGLRPGDLYQLADDKGIDVGSQDFINTCMKLANAAHMESMNQLQLRIMYDWIKDS